MAATRQDEAHQRHERRHRRFGTWMGFVGLIIGVAGLGLAYSSLLISWGGLDTDKKGQFASISLPGGSFVPYRIAPRQSNTSKAAELFNRGNELLDTDTDGAIRNYTEALKLDPKFADALTNRSRAFLKRQDLKSAFSDVEAVVDLQPNAASSYVNRSAVAIASGDLAQAYQDAVTALNLDPKNEAAQVLFVTVLVGRFEFIRAKDEATKFLARSPRNSDLYVMRAMIYIVTQEPIRCIEDATQALKLNRSNENAYFIRATCYMFNGDMAQAERDIDSAIEQHPNVAEGLVFRGLFKLARNDNTGALQDFEKAVAVDPQNAIANSLRGSAYLTKAAKPGPNNSVIFDPGLKQQAIIDLRRGVELAPRLWQTHSMLSGAYYLTGDYRAALAEADLAVTLQDFRIKPDELAQLYESRANIKRALGDKAGADSDMKLNAAVLARYEELKKQVVKAMKKKP